MSEAKESTAGGEEGAQAGLQSRLRKDVAVCEGGGRARHWLCVPWAM